MEERSIYQDQLVTITTARAVLRGVTYSVPNITSVSCARQGKRAATLVLGLILFVLSLLCFNMGKDVAPGGFVWLLSSVGLIAWYIWRVKPTYYVHIATASGETNALGSPDAAWIKTLVDAITQAIVAQG